jgi:hypothetical protein
MPSFAAARNTLEAQLFSQGNIFFRRKNKGSALRSGDVLVGVKAEGDEVSERADRLALPARAERLRGVLDYAQVVFLRDGIQAVTIDGQSRRDPPE